MTIKRRTNYRFSVLIIINNFKFVNSIYANNPLNLCFDMIFIDDIDMMILYDDILCCKEIFIVVSNTKNLFTVKNN